MIFSNTLQTANKMADYLWQKQTVTLDNIANQDTPGFKAKFVTFEDELYNNLNYLGTNSKSRNREAIQDTRIRTHVKEDESYNLDGNGVNLDVEQAELASTQIQYQQTIQQISAEFAKLRVVIK
ncbi:MAG: flagellar basal body rod protein FlgB [Bacillota bacterium]